MPLQLPAVPANGLCPPYASCRVEVPPAAGGLCVERVWIVVAPEERAERRDYPDARTYVLHLRDGRVLEVTSGGPIVRPEPYLTTVLVKDGEPVGRTAYGQGHAYRAGGLTFSGTAFDGSPADVRVFDRVRFGSAGQRRCQLAVG